MAVTYVNIPIENGMNEIWEKGRNLRIELKRVDNACETADQFKQGNIVLFKMGIMHLRN